MSIRAYAGVITSINMASIRPSMWFSAIDAMLPLVGAHSYNLITPNCPQWLSSWCVSPEVMSGAIEYASYYHQVDFFRTGFFAHGAPTLYFPDEYMSFREIKNTEMWNDLLRIRELDHVCIVSVCDNDSNETNEGWATLALHRSHKHGPYTREDKVTLERIRPHLMYALRRYIQHCKLTMASSPLRANDLRSMSRYLVLNHAGQLIDVKTEDEQWLDQYDSGIQGTRLYFHDPEVQKLYLHALHRALWSVFNDVQPTEMCFYAKKMKANIKLTLIPLSVNVFEHHSDRRSAIALCFSKADPSAFET